ncbi:MAG: aromatic amino acid DMT transporter YddG [Deltaproteobacteria bacterium]|nr:aromatic amino acid DMT transporter YddG [Deltaproteobacteria bacterium]
MPNKTDVSQINRYTIFGFCAIILWSANVALIRSISEQMGPITGGGAAYLAGGIIAVIRLFLKHPLKSIKEVPLNYLFGCGGLFLIYTISLFLAVGLANNRVQSIELGLVNYLWTPLTIVFSIFILSVKADYKLIPGTLLALFGIFSVMTKADSVSFASFAANFMNNPAAYIFGFTAAITWGLYSNLARLWGDPKAIGVVPLFVLITGIIITIIGLLITEKNQFEVKTAAEIIMFGLITVCSYVFWDMAMQQGEIILVASCSYFIPFFSTVVSCIYLKTIPGINVWSGCVFIIAGSLLSWHSVVGKESYKK